MIEFYSTQGGRRFIDGTMVTIAESLVSIDKSLKLIVKQNEKPSVRSYMDSEMYLSSSLESDHAYMDSKIKKKESNE